MLAPSKLCVLGALLGLANCYASCHESAGPKGELSAAIKRHQEALATECAKYQQAKLQRLDYLIEFEAANKNVHLASPLTVRMPAICIFILNQLELIPKGADLVEQAANQSSSKALELVNWIYPDHEQALRTRLTSQSLAPVITKRQVDQADPNKREFLSDYLYNLDDSHLEGADEGTLDAATSANEVQLQRDVDRLMSDGRFSQAIRENKAKISGRLSPVVLIPGLLGSRLQARINKSARVNSFCSKRSDWKDIWLSLRNFLPILVDCWLDNVRLELDPATNSVREPEGVESRVADFGSVESVRFLDLRSPRLTSYMGKLIEHYESLGYTADQNLLAAPYDFRLAPNQLASYFNKLAKLIERANDKSRHPVTLVCHSMGCTHALVFLRQQSATWREKRIRKLVALSSPWGGSYKALKALIVGDPLDLPLVGEARMRTLARNFPSIAYLLPQAQIFNKSNGFRVEGSQYVLAQTPDRTYYINDLEQLLIDLKLENQLEWFRQSVPLINPLEPLEDLRVDCLYSLNIPTQQSLIFRNQTDFPDGQYELIMGEGDGTVNVESLMVCRDWANKLPNKVRYRTIKNTSHTGILSHKHLLAHITDDVLLAK